jgi:hypothetical protein
MLAASDDVVGRCNERSPASGRLRESKRPIQKQDVLRDILVTPCPGGVNCSGAASEAGSRFRIPGPPVNWGIHRGSEVRFSALEGCDQTLSHNHAVGSDAITSSAWISTPLSCLILIHMYACNHAP